MLPGDGIVECLRYLPTLSHLTLSRPDFSISDSIYSRVFKRVYTQPELFSYTFGVDARPGEYH